MIKLRMLGGIRLQAESGEELDALLRQPKRLALLAYLASPTPGTWHRRDMILAFFWPELDTTRARTSLRNGIYVIRQHLGDDIIVNRGDEEISVNSALVETDVAAVLQALKEGNTAEALDQYGGELLPGLFPPDSAGFQRWLDGERTRLRTAVSGSAAAAFSALENQGRNREALQIARRVVEIQPDDETLVRRLMTLYEKVGDRAGALAVFESYRSRLATDFDAEPSAETMMLVEKLRATSEPVAKRPTGDGLGNVPVAREATISTLSSPENAKPVHRHYLATVILLLGAGVAAFTVLHLSQPTLRTLGVSAPVTSDEGLQVEPAISPNGRLVAYARGNAGHLRIFVQKIGSLSSWPLNPNSSEVELMPRWSPENDEIVFLSQNNAYAAPSGGGAPRLIARGASGDGMVRSASWSPEGDSVLLVRNDSLFAKPAESSGIRLIARAKQLHSCVWSPNRKHIACVAGNVIALTPGPLFGNEAPSAIIVFAAATGDAVDITSNRFEHKSPAWSADGNFLWFLSDRDGVSGEAYAQLISSDGKKRGPLQRLGLKAEWLSLAVDKMVYSLPTRKANIWSVPVPTKTANFENAKQLTFGNQIVETVSVSRDRKWLYFDSNLRGNSDIYRTLISGGPAERLTDDPGAEYAPDHSPIQDEFAWQRFVNGERHLFAKKVQNDSGVELMPVKGDQGVPRWSPDGSSIVAWSHENERGGVFVLKRGADGRWSAPSWRLDFGQVPIWSPDGSKIAFVLQDGSVQTIAADSGSIGTLYSPRPRTNDPQAIFLVWSKNSESIWMMGIDADGGAGIWALPARGGPPQLRVRLGLPPGMSAGPSFATDDSRFYLTMHERSAHVRWAELKKK